jgi:hypothetical protein
MTCSGTNWGELTFVLDVLIILSSTPIAYLSWASGLMSSMFGQAKANGWVYPPRRVKPKVDKKTGIMRAGDIEVKWK